MTSIVIFKLKLKILTNNIFEILKKNLSLENILKFGKIFRNWKKVGSFDKILKFVNKFEIWKRFGNSENIWKSEEKKMGNLGKKWKFG